MRRALSLALGVACAIAPLTAGGYAAGASAPRPQVLPVGFVDTLVGNVSSPTTVHALPNGTVAVLSKGGAVRIIRSGAVLPAPAITVGNLCTTSERGLLGIAGDKNFNSTGFVYLYYTFNNSGTCVNRVSRFTMANDLIDAATEVVLVDNIPSTGGNHNGGDVEIGKDGFLYISIGDSGVDPRGSLPNDAAQDLSLPNGKILRVDPTTGGPAPGNPFSGTGTASCRTAGTSTATNLKCQEIFAYGLRNPFRFAFDPNAAGTRFFIDDVGQSTREEVDEGAIGANYGWNLREGQCPLGQNPPCAGPPFGFTDPITDYGRTIGQFIVGGAFVPNGYWPAAYNDGYLFGDGGSGSVWLRKADGSVDYANPFFTAPGFVDMDFVQESGGLALYYSSGGDIHKLLYPSQPPPVASTALHYVAVPAVNRVLDTRTSAGGGAPIPAATARSVATGVDGSVTKAVLVNLTFVVPASDGFLTAWANGAAKPATSNVNARAGEVVANAAIVPVDASGNIQVYSNTATDVVIDLLGRFEQVSGPVAAGRLVPVDPQRLIDTREVTSSTNQFTETAAGSINRVNAPMAGRKGIPAAGTSSVAVIVTAVAGPSSGGGFVTVTAGGAPLPLSSNVNINGSGDVRPNLVVVPVAADGSIDLHLSGVADVLVDVVGYFTDSTAPAALTGRFRSLSPYREVDTRTPAGFTRFDVAGVRTFDPVSVPATAIAVSHNITIVDNADPGFITAYPSDPRPNVSNANADRSGQFRASAAFTKLAPDGSVKYYALMATDLVVDATGYFEGSAGT